MEDMNDNILADSENDFVEFWDRDDEELLHFDRLLLMLSIMEMKDLFKPLAKHFGTESISCDAMHIDRNIWILRVNEIVVISISM